MDDELYSFLRPVSVNDVGCCFYCGCEAEYSDYAPPARYAEFYIKTSEGSSFAIVPCCNECKKFLDDCRKSLIDERKTHINKKIERKYKRALLIFERWSEDETEDQGDDFRRSITAGIKLGEEAYHRLKYAGFEYEVDGTKYQSRMSNVKKYIVFGEEFNGFRDALQYASRAYAININVLKEWLIEHNADFNNAISAYFDEKEREIILKKKKLLCSDFSKKHKQNINFVLGALDAYEKSNPDLTLEQCLNLIYEERVKKNIRH